MSEESSLWKGGPSQWLNAGHFIVAILLGAAISVGGVFFPPAFAGLVLPLGYAVWKYLEVKSRTYELTSERLITTSGVFNQKVDDMELYRVKDSVVVREWWMRLAGLASIDLESSDRSMPRIVIPAIRGGEEMRDLLRKQVELQRDKKRVRETDLDDMAGGAIHG